MVSGSSTIQSHGQHRRGGEGAMAVDLQGLRGRDRFLVELLQGRFSKGVMERICRQEHGLFPRPAEIRFSCSCPDYASMCKHVAAVLYGVGARLDAQPELLFRLRAVDENELVAHIDQALPMSKASPAAGKMLASDDLSAIFGLEMAGADGQPGTPGKTKAPRSARKVATRPAHPVRERKSSPTRIPCRPPEGGPLQRRGRSSVAASKGRSVRFERGRRGHVQPSTALRRSRLAAGHSVFES